MLMLSLVVASIVALPIFVAEAPYAGEQASGIKALSDDGTVALPQGRSGWHRRSIREIYEVDIRCCVQVY
jgi:hypothetical protein